MNISQETINLIKGTANIVEVLQDYLPELYKSGKDFKANCPFHKEKMPSLFISPSKNIFHCFGCNVGGDMFHFIMKHDNVLYMEALVKVAKKYNIDLSKENIANNSNSQQHIIYSIIKTASDYYHEILLEENCAKQAREYLEYRHITKESIDKFKIGFAPNENRILNAGIQKYNLDILIKTGLVAMSSKYNSPYDHIRNRIIFPISDINSNIIGFGGRTLPESNINPPYLNTSETDVYNKSRCLYGLNHAINSIRQSKYVILVEGYMDVIACHQNGFNNVVAPLGTNLTYEQIKLLKRFTNIVYIFFDPDNSGQQASIRASEMLIEENINCYIGGMPDGMDPDELLSSADGRNKFEQIIANSINPIKYHLLFNKDNLLRTESKRIVIKDILNMINKIKDNIYKYEMIKILSNEVNIKEDMLLQEIKKDVDDTKDNIEKSQILSIEEEIVCLCLQYPDICKNIDLSYFNDERCINLLSRISKDEDFNLSNILDKLDDDLTAWITRLTFRYLELENPILTLNKFMNDLILRNKKQKYKQLEIEVIHMLEGKEPVNNLKIQEYQELAKTLKCISR